jgi:broad-specificity NMP kinase
VTVDILWLNGPFGVGKTTVATLLTDRRLVDPERIGFVMRRTFWRGRDYQDVPLWRKLTVRQVRRASRRGPIVVPMTIVNRTVLDEVIGKIDGVRVVALLAPRDEIVRRIAGDTRDPAAHDWRVEQIDRCLAAFADPAFGVHVDTVGKTPEQIAKEIG